MRGDLYVISAPSGTGKTTLCRLLLKEMDGISFSVSHTTRPPRPGEVDGVDYHFVSKADFLAMEQENAFLEYAEVHNHLYGTSKQAVLDQLSQGIDVILDIDVKGAMQVKARFPDAIMIFILPPSLKELERRLRSRNTEDEKSLKIRIKNAKEEILAAPHYDYLIINDELSRALDDFKAIIKANRQKKDRMLESPMVAKVLLEAKES